MLTRDFLVDFKTATEQRWSQHSIDPAIFGFQFQRGTLWNPGLSDREIAEYEHVVGVRFPHDFRVFLRMMNGTDIANLNVYGYCGEPHRTSFEFYSYPRDLDIVKQQIEKARKSRDEIAADLKGQGFDLSKEAGLVPIYSHRYLVCMPNLNNSAVLSIVVDAVDAIVCSKSLQDFLEHEFLKQQR